MFPKITPMNSKQVKQVRQVPVRKQATATTKTQIGKLSFKKPTGCGCGMNKWKVI